MPYASGRVIHDADAHIMELPGFLEDHLETKYRGRVGDDVLFRAARAFTAISRMRETARPSTKARSCCEELGRARFFHAPGPAALDRPFGLCQPAHVHDGAAELFVGARRRAGSRSHLCRGARPYAAHGRVLLGRPAPAADGYVPLVDFERTAKAAKEAIELGAKALMILRAAPTLIRRATSASIPVGDRRGGRPADRLPRRRRRQALEDAWFNNGLPPVPDFHGGDEQFQVDRLHGDRLSADEGADRADRRPRARPLPQAEVRRHRAGRVVGAGLDAQHGFSPTTPSTRTRSGCRRCRSGRASS